MSIRIDPVSPGEAGLWRATLEVAGLFEDIPWVIIGAQMIMLLGREQGVTSGRTTRDLDAIVDVRAIAGGSRTAASRLVMAAFELSSEHPHRFLRGPDAVDLLAPDHLGSRADLTTVPPMSTVAIPGGSRALATRRLLAVRGRMATRSSRVAWASIRARASGSRGTRHRRTVWSAQQPWWFAGGVIRATAIPADAGLTIRTGMRRAARPRAVSPQASTCAA